MRNKLGTCLPLVLLYVACGGPYINLPGNVKVERKTVCGGTNNCGVAGELRSVSGDNPRTMKVTSEGDPDVAEILGNKLDDTYQPAKYCGELLTKDVIDRARNGGEHYDVQVNYTGNDKTELKASLKAGIEGKLSSSAKGKAAFEAVVDRTVEEITKGTYQAVIQSYTLDGGDTEKRTAACKAALSNGKYVISLAVIQFSADATNELKKKLIANIRTEAQVNADLKATTLNADGSLQAGLDNQSDVVAKIATARISRVIILGFSPF